MIYFIIIILLIVIFISSSKFLNESFTCNRDLYYSDKLFRPIRPIIINFKKFNDANNTKRADFIINKETIDNIIKNIKIDIPQHNIYEINESDYDYKKGYTSYIYDKKKLIDIINKFYSKIIPSFEKNINNNSICNNKCSLSLKNYSIKRLGKMKNILVIEGQLIIYLNDNTRYFVLEFVISEKQKIYSLKCSGIDNKPIIQNNLQEMDIINNKVRIMGSPIYGKYDLPKKYIYSSVNDNLNAKISPSKTSEFPYYCFGADAFNKLDCEKVVNNKQGIWDKSCESDEECPFYKYNSVNGGCNKGLCQFPLGVTRISPRKYYNLDNALCSGCLTDEGKTKNGNCCREQLNKKKYPNLKVRPNFIFKSK